MGIVVPIIFRSAENVDVPSMAAIRAKESGGEALWVDRIGRYLSGAHSPQQALPERAAYVAVHEHRIVGFVAGHRTRRFDCDGELQWINVVQEKRGQGIAARLLVEIGSWFVQHNACRVCVNVEPANQAARRVYARCGAQRLNEYWMIWEDAWTMERPDTR